MEEFNLDEVDHLLTTTRAVRKRLDLSRTVPRELILDCVKVSTQAPAGGNYQKWRWVIIDDPEKKLIIGFYFIAILISCQVNVFIIADRVNIAYIFHILYNLYLHE